MTLLEALRIANDGADPRSAQAHRLLRDAALKLARRYEAQTGNGALEEIASDVVQKVLRRARTGALVLDRGEESLLDYLKKSVRHRFIDWLRVERRQQSIEPGVTEVDTVLLDEAPGEEAHSAALRARAHALLDRLFTEARTARKQVDAFDADVALARRFLADPLLDSTSVVAASGLVEADDPAAFRRARNVIHQRQKRLKDALRAAAEALIARGELREDERGPARECVRLLDRTPSEGASAPRRRQEA